jgi:hypothetical protein
VHVGTGEEDVLGIMLPEGMLEGTNEGVVVGACEGYKLGECE